MLIASLPMYDHPEVRAATDSWWSGLAKHMRKRGLAVPLDLTRPSDDLMAHWRHPALFFSQICGRPAAMLGTDIELIATPVYAVPGCDGANYRSVMVARHNGPQTLPEAAGGVAAITDTHSQSGYVALKEAVSAISGGRPFFRAVVRSGAHRRSIALVRNGSADVAAIDCVSWALLKTHAGETVEGVREIGWTTPAPGLCYITRPGLRGDIPAMRAALMAALADEGLELARAALFIAGAEVIPADAYRALLQRDADAGDALTPTGIGQAG